MFCPNCGKELPEKAIFCSKCGTPVPGDRAGAGVDAGVRTAQPHAAASRANGTATGFAGKARDVLSSVISFFLSLPKVVIAVIIGVVVIGGVAGIVTAAGHHGGGSGIGFSRGDIPSGTYMAQYGSTSIGQGGTIVIRGDEMSIENIAGSAYYTDMAPYEVSGGMLYYHVTEDDYFWVSDYYSTTSGGDIVFSYYQSGEDIVLDGVTYYRQ